MAKSFNPFAFIATLLDSWFSSVQGEERVAGIVIEYDRVRYAEFRRARKGEASYEGRVLVGEGAVSLPEGTIRGGSLAHADALVEALKKLRKEGKPQPLTTNQVLLALPIVRLLGSAVTLPAGISESETTSAMLLEIETSLPFPIEEAYLDWQLLSSAPKGGGREFLFAGSRQLETQPYVDAAKEAGLGVVAVEPVTLAMARGMHRDTDVTYIAEVYPDALLGAAIDSAGNVLYFHHRSLPTITSTKENADQSAHGASRARRLVLELSAFVRFLRDKFGEQGQQLIIDGDLEGEDVEQLKGLSASLGIPVRLEHGTHLLSRAAARGSGLRGMLPRADDKLISLMRIGTEAAYAERQAVFFFQASLRLLIAGTLIAILMIASTWGFLLKLENDTEAATRLRQSAVPEATRKALDLAKEVNELTASILDLLSSQQIPPGVLGALQDVRPLGIAIESMVLKTNTDSVDLELAIVAQDGAALKAMQTVLRETFAADPTEVVVAPDIIVSNRTRIPHIFTFQLSEKVTRSLHEASSAL